MADEYKVVDMMKVPNPNPNPKPNPNKYNFSNFGCFAADQDSMHTFCVKTDVKSDERNSVSKVCYYESCSTSSVIGSVQVNVGHGNTMALTNNYIYLPVSYDHTILRLARKNVTKSIEKKIPDLYKLVTPSGGEATNERIKSITYMGANKKFILRLKKGDAVFVKTEDGNVSKDTIEYERFCYATVDSTNKTFLMGEEFLVPHKVNSISANTQDMHYNSKNGLFLPRPYKIPQTKEGNLVGNQILQVDIRAGKETMVLKGLRIELNKEENKISVDVSRKVYQPKKVIVMDRKVTEFSRYEIEAVSFTTDNYLLYGGNFRKAGQNSDTDKIKKIANMKFTL